MTPVLFLVVSLAGGLGAVARFAIDALAARLVGRRSRWGIIAVNVTGSFALGLVSVSYTHLDVYKRQKEAHAPHRAPQRLSLIHI